MLFEIKQQRKQRDLRQNHEQSPCDSQNRFRS